MKTSKAALLVSGALLMTLVACGERTRKTATRAAGAGENAANKANDKTGNAALAQMPGLIKVTGPLARNTSEITVVASAGKSADGIAPKNKVEPQITDVADQAAVKSLSDVSNAKTIYADQSCDAELVKSMSASHGDLKSVEAKTAGPIKTIAAQVVFLCGEIALADKSMLSVKAQELFLLKANIRSNSLSSKVILTAGRITLDGDSSITVNALDGENSSTTETVIEISSADEIGTALKGTLKLTSIGAKAKGAAATEPVSDQVPASDVSKTQQSGGNSSANTSADQNKVQPSAKDITGGDNQTPDDNQIPNVTETTPQLTAEQKAEREAAEKQKAEAEAKEKADADAKAAAEKAKAEEGDAPLRT